jgi:hypothetical protein
MAGSLAADDLELPDLLASLAAKELHRNLFDGVLRGSGPPAGRTRPIRQSSAVLGDDGFSARPPPSGWLRD